MEPGPAYPLLKERQRAERDQHHENLALRVHRALSWLNRAEQCDDLDGRFIFLWIAFNAAYAVELDPEIRPSEQKLFVDFLSKLGRLDTEGKIADLVWHQFSGPIRLLLDNPYIFRSFWDHQRGAISSEDWRTQQAADKRAVNIALGSGDTTNVLRVLFNRLYTLRNQMLHGGATWNSRVNRDQMRDAVNFMHRLVPIIIELMLDNSTTLWGDASYPVVEA